MIKLKKFVGFKVPSKMRNVTMEVEMEMVVRILVKYKTNINVKTTKQNIHLIAHPCVRMENSIVQQHVLAKNIISSTQQEILLHIDVELKLKLIINNVIVEQLQHIVNNANLRITLNALTIERQPILVQLPNLLVGRHVVIALLIL